MILANMDDSLKEAMRRFQDRVVHKQPLETSMPSDMRGRLVRAPDVATWFQGQDADPPYLEIRKDGIEPSVFDGLEKAFAGCDFPIFLHGKQGRGKTMAAYYFARRCYPKPGVKQILWYRSPRDLQHDIISNRSETIGNFRECSIAVIDNFGATSNDLSDFLADELVALLDRRLYRPTIICSNLAPSEIKDRLAAPLVSRLFGGTVIEYPGQDRRVQRSASRKRNWRCGQFPTK